MKNSYDFLRIWGKRGNNEQKIIGVINFNNMIPVDESIIRPTDLHINSNDTPRDKAYKELLNDQLDWCNDNCDLIIHKAQKLYEMVNNPQKNTSVNLLKRCCDFKKLEKVLDNYISKQTKLQDDFII